MYTSTTTCPMCGYEGLVLATPSRWVTCDDIRACTNRIKQQKQELHAQNQILKQQLTDKKDTP